MATNQEFGANEVFAQAHNVPLPQKEEVVEDRVKKHLPPDWERKQEMAEIERKCRRGYASRHHLTRFRQCGEEI